MALFRRYQQLRLDIKRVVYILKHSITRRLLVVVFSIYLIVTITVTLFHMDFEYEFSKHTTVAALKNIQAMIHESVSQAIWEFNNTQLDTILHGLFSNEYIVGVKLVIPANDAMQEMQSKELGLIENDQGELVYIDPHSKNATPVYGTFERLIPDSFDITHTDALNRTLFLGKMYLYSSNRVVFEMVKQSFLLIIFNAIIKTVALWVFFLWAGYYFISKPLVQLTDAIKQLSTGNWTSELVYKTRKKSKKTEINALFDSFNDMTRNLHQTQDKLRSSRNRLNSIFDTMPSALASVNNKLIVLGWNKDMATLTNIPGKDAIDKNILEIFPPFAEYEYLMQDALRKDKEQQEQHVKIDQIKDSAHRLFHITAYPVTTLKPPELMIRIDDVTDQVKQENDLAQVEKLASVGASIAGVAHEINNPLASIMQSTQNIERRLDPNLEANKQAAAKLQIDLQKQAQYLQEREIIKFLNSIREAGERASSIVKNMLKFTRRSTADMSRHNLVEIINESLLLAANDIAIQEHADFKDVKIQKDFKTRDLEIECYPQEIQQVILNIIRNAIQAMDPERPDKDIIISLDTADNRAIIKISDNGQGMTNEIMLQIFQPFFTTKPAGMGTGLGLSVCRNIIVQKHHGTMDVESTVGKGTTFIISLPIEQPK